jgi:hypothetical protein
MPVSKGVDPRRDDTYRLSWLTEAHLGDLLMMRGSENKWGRIMK